MHGVPLKKKISVTERLASMTTEYVNNMRFESSPLCQLFYPQKTQDYDSITPTRAVEEIETFLKTGKGQHGERNGGSIIYRLANLMPKASMPGN
jgi:uncharacterized protein (UPF0128 family)